MINPQTLDDLRKEAQRIANHELTALTPEKQTALTQLVYELDVTRVDLEMQNEELRKVSRQLALSRDEFHDLYETAPVAFVTMNGKGIIERVNAAAEQLLAGTRCRVVGCGFSMFVHPDDCCHYHSRLHTSEQYPGTGMGLAIVSKAAAKFGGTVRLESVPGTGSTFYLRMLPKGRLMNVSKETA